MLLCFVSSRRRHTRYWRDWSSDVCSSDLLTFYAAYITGLKLMVATGYIAVALAIFWRKSADWMALFVAFMLVIFGTATAPETMPFLAAAHPKWQLPVAFMNFFGVAFIGLFLYLFPSGRFVPRWTRWIAVAWVVWEALA